MLLAVLPCAGDQEMHHTLHHRVDQRSLTRGLFGMPSATVPGCHLGSPAWLSSSSSCSGIAAFSRLLRYSSALSAAGCFIFCTAAQMRKAELIATDGVTQPAWLSLSPQDFVTQTDKPAILVPALPHLSAECNLSVRGFLRGMHRMSRCTIELKHRRQRV